MPTVQSPNRRPKRTGALRPTGPTPLLDFLRAQAEAIEAAQSNGIEQMVFTVRPDTPGALHVETKISTKDASKLWAVLSGRAVEEQPTPKLARAIKEAAKVTTFYKTKEELFDALERED